MTLRVDTSANLYVSFRHTRSLAAVNVVVFIIMANLGMSQERTLPQSASTTVTADTAAIPFVILSVLQLRFLHSRILNDQFSFLITELTQLHHSIYASRPIYLRSDCNSGSLFSLLRFKHVRKCYLYAETTIARTSSGQR